MFMLGFILPCKSWVPLWPILDICSVQHVLWMYDVQCPSHPEHLVPVGFLHTDKMAEVSLFNYSIIQNTLKLCLAKCFINFVQRSWKFNFFSSFQDLLVLFINVLCPFKASYNGGKKWLLLDGNPKSRFLRCNKFQKPKEELKLKFKPNPANFGCNNF